MGRPRGEKREAAKRLYLERKGRVSTKELAALAGVPENKIRTWKSADRWEDALKHRRGAPLGNKNGKGAGAGNKNAEKHGAFSAVDWDKLPPGAAEKIQEWGDDVPLNLRVTLFKLRAKEADLEARISALDGGEEERNLVLETELDRVRGRIIRLLESIRGYEVDLRRLDLEERKLKLAREKAMGMFEVEENEDE